MTSLHESLGQGWQHGVGAIRSELVAGALLWITATLIVILFFYVPYVTSTLDKLGELKSEWNYTFDVVSVGLSAGFLPSVLASGQRMWCNSDGPENPQQGGSRTEPAPKLTTQLYLVAARTVLFAAYGVWTDLFYQLQAAMFGDNDKISTLAKKTAVDQLLITPLIEVPTIQLLLLFIDCWLNWKDFSSELQRREYLSVHGLLAKWWFPALLPTWLIWVPSLFAIYALPESLEVPMFCMVMVLWSLIQLTVLGNSTNHHTDSEKGIELHKGTERQALVKTPGCDGEARPQQDHRIIVMREESL